MSEHDFGFSEDIKYPGLLYVRTPTLPQNCLLTKATTESCTAHTMLIHLSIMLQQRVTVSPLESVFAIIILSPQAARMAGCAQAHMLQCSCLSPVNVIFEA